MFLLPPSLRDWLPENHLVYFVSDVVDQMDLTEIDAVYARISAANRLTIPMMTKILVYGYRIGVFSSRRISGWSRMWRSGCWRRATCRTSAPSRIFGRFTWIRCWAV